MQVHSFIAIIQALNQASVKYLVVGGIAVNAHGFERLTKDLDLVLWLESNNIRKASQALEGLGFQPRIPVSMSQLSDPEARNRWKNEKHMVVFQLWSDQHPRTPIDLFIEEPFDFHQEYAKAFEQPVDDKTVAKIVSLETLIQMKKAAGRTRDLADIEDLKLIYGERFPTS